MNEANEKSLRVAIVGAGYVSGHHINALQSLGWVDIVGIADIDPDLASSVASKFAIPCATRSLAELAACRPDAVYVLTPPSSHCALALEALEMGCHVFVEKPMAETVAECDRMIALATEKNLLLSVNHSDRLDPVILKALAKVASGACGDILAVDFFRGSEYAPFAGGRRGGPYRKGSYAFQDIGVHALYLMEAFLGPIGNLDVRYRRRGTDPNFLFDDWIGTADCQRGTGRMHLSWVSRPMMNRLLIQGTRGSIDVDRFMQTLVIDRVYPGPKFVGMVLNAIVGSLRRIASVTWNVGRFALGRLAPSPGIRAGARGFAMAAAGRAALQVPADEGRHMVSLMEAVCAAADTDADEIYAGRLAELEPADILVTGASGFVGSALLRRLADGTRVVRVLLRRDAAWIARLPHVQVVIGDLGDAELVGHAVRGVDTVYHVGAAMKGGRESFQAGTTAAVANIIDSCTRHGTRRLVYVSSMSVFQHADRPDDCKVTEEYPYESFPGRRGLYTQTKLEAEQAILSAVRERQLPAVIVRPGQIFGPGAENVPPNGVISIGGRWILVGPGNKALPLVYIDDVIDALILAGTSDGVEGRAFNIVDTAIVTQNRYLDACRKKLADLRIVRIPTPIMFALASGVELLGKLLRRDVPLSRYRVKSLRPLSNFDTSMAENVLHWTPRVGSAAGISRTFDQ